MAIFKHEFVRERKIDLASIGAKFTCDNDHITIILPANLESLLSTNLPRNKKPLCLTSVDILTKRFEAILEIFHEIKRVFFQMCRVFYHRNCVVHHVYVKPEEIVDS